MIPAAVALALAAAVLHATWNVLLKTSGDPLLTMTRAMVAAVAVFTPPVALAWLLIGRPGVPLAVWGLITVSSLAQLAYAVCLSAAYRRGDLSTVYPIARGTAPLLAVPAGLLLGERLQAVNWVGVVCLLAGIWIVRRPARGQSSTLPAVLTGVFIATYSAIDTKGVHLVPPWLYGWGIWVGSALMMQGWVWLWSRLPAGMRIRSIPRHGGTEENGVETPALRPGRFIGSPSGGLQPAPVPAPSEAATTPAGQATGRPKGHTSRAKEPPRPQGRGFVDAGRHPHGRESITSGVQPMTQPAYASRTRSESDAESVPNWGRAVAIGIPMTIGYMLVLVAFHLAPLIVVAPVRESAVVLVAGWSVWKLRERRQLWQRLVGTAAVLAGIVLVAV